MCLANFSDAFRSKGVFIERDVAEILYLGIRLHKVAKVMLLLT